MPNWCYNHITMKKEDFDKNKHLFITGEDDDTKLDFSILIPHDPSVRADLYYDNHTGKGGLLTNDNWNRQENPLTLVQEFDNLTEDFFVDAIGERQKLLVETGWTRKDGWYDWQCEHWGTKWNGGECDIDEDDDYVNINFNTAWACPEPFFHELAKHCAFSCDGEEECRSFTYEGETTDDGEFLITYDEDPEPEEDDEEEISLEE